MNPEPTNQALEMLRRLRSEQSAGFNRVETMLTDRRTQIRIHGGHIASLVLEETFTTSLPCPPST
jgi:hypothetical protein